MLSCIAGSVRTKEVASVAAESCEGTAVNIIQQTLFYSEINAHFSTMRLPRADPCGQPCDVVQ